MNSDVLNATIILVMFAIWMIAVLRVKLFDCIRCYGKKDLFLAGFCLLGSYLYALYAISNGVMMSQSNEQSIAHYVDKLINNLLNQNVHIVSCFCYLLFGCLIFVIWGMTEKRVSDRLLKSNLKFSIGILGLITIKQLYIFKWSILHMLVALLLASAICSVICIYHKQRKLKYIYPVICILMLVVLAPTLNVVYEVSVIGVVSLIATVLANVIFHFSYYLRDVFKYIVNIGVVIGLICLENVVCNICL